ncbi:MAG: site-specific integrase [Oscillospiraceae bacterium]|jgi:integrase|nr:site-specific integrase [Oscillospiraceae bacterium]
MPRRGENIYKRKDGRWEGRILLSDGKYRYFYAKAYRELKEKMKNYREEDLSSLQTQTDMAETICAQFLSWIEGDIRHQIKPSTYENYQYCVQKYIIPFFAETKESQITTASAAQFTSYIKCNETISESYKRKILTIFKTALKKILNDSPDIASIIDAVKLPKIKGNEVQVFTTREQQLIEYAALNSENRRALGLILCFYSGIRLGELCGLKWSDFDWDAGTMSIMRTVTRAKNFEQEGNKTALHIGTPKSRTSIRKIPLPAFILQQAKALGLDQKREGYFVLSDNVEPLDPRSYQKLFQRVLIQAGIKARKFHAIRHTFATRALELGVDIKTLSELLGHSNVSITLNIYAHSLLEQKKIAIDKFNSMYVSNMSVGAFAVHPAVIYESVCDQHAPY